MQSFFLPLPSSCSFFPSFFARVCVASTNPVKLKAIQTAFEALFEPHEGDCEGDNKLDDGEKTKKSKSISFVTGKDVPCFDSQRPPPTFCVS